MAQQRSWSSGATSYAPKQPAVQQQHQKQHDLEDDPQQPPGYGAWSNNWQQQQQAMPPSAFPTFAPGMRPTVIPAYGIYGQYPPIYYNAPLAAPAIGMPPDAPPGSSGGTTGPTTGVSGSGNVPGGGYHQGYPPAFPYYGAPHPQWVPPPPQQQQQQPLQWNSGPAPVQNPNPVTQNGYRRGGSNYNHKGNHGGYQCNNQGNAGFQNQKFHDNDRRGWKRGRDNTPNNNTRQQRPWSNNRNFGGGSGGGDRIRLQCETCDRTFTGRGQMEDHMKTHVKCPSTGCSFEAIGTVVNEHMATVHCTKRPAKALTKEQAEEVQRWCEARKRNYPTNDNIRRKLQKLQELHAKGDFVDEEALKRQESLKEILAKQKELGCIVAEIPMYYLSARYVQRNTPGQPTEVPEGTFEEGESREISAGDRGNAWKPCPYYRRGSCRKGRRCTFLHSRVRSKKDGPVASGSSGGTEEAKTKPRASSLLAKLLQPDIERERSQLLQCFRFLVNNDFLKDESAPLKHFDWVEDGVHCDERAALRASIGKDVSDVESDDGDEGEEAEEEAEDGEVRYDDQENEGGC